MLSTQHWHPALAALLKSVPLETEQTMPDKFFVHSSTLSLDLYSIGTTFDVKL